MDETETPAISGPSGDAVCAYVEDLLLELAEMATNSGESALAAALGLVAIQAGMGARRRPSDKADQSAREELGPTGQG